MNTNIREKLSKTCSFASAWNTLDEEQHPRQEMSYACSHNNGSWKTSYYTVHKELITKNRWLELLKVVQEMTRAFPTLLSLAVFCTMNADTPRDGEYNLYMEGNAADYWICTKVETEDYRLYIHSIAKEES